MDLDRTAKGTIIRLIFADMWAVYKKEIRQFFSNLTGYIAILVFLLLNGLFLFVFSDNILDFGYATLDKFFELAPWVLLLLVPAITMRSFSEEFRSGTFETLQTSPLTKWQIVSGKYFAGLTVAVIVLLPTIIYFFSVQNLAGQNGIDVGAAIGSYIGLFFLASVFVAIGVCCSSFTGNPVIAFIFAACICLILYSGFAAISAVPLFAAGADYYIEMLGIDFHYRSMSRGVIDSRDIIFFVAVVFFFLCLTKKNLEKQKRLSNRFGWLGLLICLVAVNFLGSAFHYRLDLTEEKRYTLSEPTIRLLRKIDDPISIDVFLKGDLKAGIKKLEKSTEELLEEFNSYSGGKISFQFYDPLQQLDDTAKALLVDSLGRMDIHPMTLVAQSKKGEEQSQRTVIPGAIVKYKDRIYPVNLLNGVQGSREGQAQEQLYANAETLLEFKFASAIDKITQKEIPAVGYAMGNGEVVDFSVYDLIEDLRKNYGFNRSSIVQLDSIPFIAPELKALIIVKPTIKFTDAEKLKLDQYLMRGGNIIWMVDFLHADLDSLRMDKETMAYDRGLNLEDIFFKYGIRVNPDLVEDMQCASINFVMGMQGDKPQIQLLSWPYFPLLDGSTTHPISKNLDPVYAKFSNSIDTVTAKGIEKTVILQTSANSRIVSAPAIVSFESLKKGLDPKQFNLSNIPVAMLMEGKFSSLYANRISSSVADTLASIYKQPFLPMAEKEAKIIVCADAEIAMNEVTPHGPVPMGMDKDISFTFANKDFVQNCIEYLVNPSGIIETRSKEFSLRLLDPQKVEDERSFWQFINILLPLILVILAGFIYQAIRKGKYS
jgi:ABC-2 type transport system permease protein